MNGGTLIELCGLPGVGKSSLARSVGAALAERGIACPVVDAPISAAADRHRRVARKGVAATVQAARHPLAALDAGRWAVASRQESPRDAFGWLGQWLAVRQAIEAARRVPGSQLVEEGVVQSLWTLGLRARSDGVDGLLERTPRWMLGDLLVVVEAPTGLVADRLTARRSRHSRTQALAPVAQVDELRRGAALLDELVAASRVPVLRLSNERPDGLPDLAGQVVERVARSCADRSHPLT